jgi:hypothetical protein
MPVATFVWTNTVGNKEEFVQTLNNRPNENVECGSFRERVTTCSRRRARVHNQ